MGFCVAALSIWSNVDPDNGILSKCWQFWLILLFSILAGGCQWRQSILDTKTKNIVDDLKRKLDQANLEISSLLLIKQNIGRIFQCCLQDIANALKFTTQERISLYIILDDEFALCSRISSNPRWQECGRSSYPKAQGIIGRAWEERQCFENQMPQYSKNNKKYVNYMKKKYHVPIDVTEALSMKSRLYFGYRLDDHNGQAPVGVFVIESLASEKFTEEELINVLNGDKGIRIDYALAA